VNCPLPITTLIDLACELPWSLARHEVYSLASPCSSLGSPIPALEKRD
jgi:hypothetical protein